MKKTLNKKTVRNANLISHIAIALASCLLSVAIISWDKGLFKTEFREGDIALRDIYAPYDFTIRGEMDNTATEAKKIEAIQSVLTVYVYEEEGSDIVLNKARAIMESAQLLIATPELTEEGKKERIREIAASYNISEALMTDILGVKDREDFINDAEKAVKGFMLKGVISSSEIGRLKSEGIELVTLVDKFDGREEERDVGTFLTLEEAKEDLRSFPFSIREKKDRIVMADFINAILTINVRYDRELTESRKRLAGQEVSPVYNTIEVKKNEIVLNKGERIGKGHIAKLQGIEQSEPSVMRIGGIFAVAILVGLIMLLISLYVRFYEPELLRGNNELLLVSIICVLLLFVAKLIAMSPWPSNLIPVAVSSMLIAILINGRMAIITTCFLSILVGIISGNRLDIAGVSLVGGIVGIFAMRGVRRRSQVISAGISVGFANMSYLIAIGLARSLNFNIYITESFFGFANGLMSAVIVTGVLPIFENLFKITTDISLLELADLNHPLLKEMVIKAPGTYHHSLVVGNLAEAACEIIGANPLLARVSSYFHDIGKIEKASYYSENQSAGSSAHDKLLPTMSSLIITNHVKNGVEIAQQYKLNRKIIDIIGQHHGTGLVFYFFKRALEKVTDEDVGEQSFRYPGPKPQTKEGACVLLADSVEAASRALDDPTPSRIKGLVRKIINNKFIDGQLDECDLTLKDLEKISEVFTHILTGIFHTRVEYPEGPEGKAS